MLVTDRSWTVLLDVTIAKSKSDRMSNRYRRYICDRCGPGSQWR